MGVQGIQAVVQNIALPVSGNTPERRITVFYNRSNDVGAFVHERRVSCSGMYICKPVETKTQENTTVLAQIKRS